ncbi:MAG: dienelactone hydrolase family protein, partial [Vulcanimicrobiaceae bacterium]
LFPEAFGINDYIQSECRRLGQLGYAVIAPDFFRGEVYSYDDMPKVMAKLQTFTKDFLMEDVRAAVRFAEDRDEIESEQLGAVGFCMGGRLAFLTALELGTRIGAAASFYGGGLAPEKPRFFEPLVDRIPELQSPVLLIYGAEDEGIAPSEHARLAEALSRNKKRYTLTVFPDAGHGFASIDRPSYRREAAEAAWDLTLEFFATHMA